MKSFSLSCIGHSSNLCGGSTCCTPSGECLGTGTGTGTRTGTTRFAAVRDVYNDCNGTAIALDRVDNAFHRFGPTVLHRRFLQCSFKVIQHFPTSDLSRQHISHLQSFNLFPGEVAVLETSQARALNRLPSS